MAAVTLSEVSALTERESVYWYFGGAFRTAGRHLALVLVWPILLVTVILLAQVFPSRMRRTLDEILPRLDRVSDKAVLALLRDLFSLALCAAVFYNKFCLFSRRTMKGVIEDLDETVDSLNFSVENWESMTAFVEDCEKKSNLELPLFARRA